MLIHRIDNFLTDGTGALPPGDWRAIALHPSSEVDLVDVSGQLLSEQTIVPLGRDVKLTPIRNAPTLIEPNNALFITNQAVTAGQTLIVQLYDACDALIAPAPRRAVPCIRQAVIVGGQIRTTLGTSGSLVMRVPMSGREQCRITFKRQTNIDLQLLTVSVGWGVRAVSTLYGAVVGGGLAGHIKENSVETWFEGAGTAPVCTAGELATTPQFQCRSINVGGDGDAAEVMDELLIFIAGANGGAAEINAEAR